jgi:phosphatidate phosphatase APP1
MKRPYLISFFAIASQGITSVRCSIALQDVQEFVREEPVISSPYQFMSLFPQHQFKIKIVGLNENNEEVYSRIYETESYGLLNTKFASSIGGQEITKIQIYEIKYRRGIDLLLGTSLVFKLQENFKLIISDFDKTLVDTKYSSPREVYLSLRKPLSFFPTVQASVDLIKEYMAKGHHPFILSASPHFYEKPFRDWLYQNDIYSSFVFLKDYSKLLSWTESELSIKDIKKQGFYKLNHLVDILLMTGIPDELVLVGDGFESDLIIYLVLRSILVENIDPLSVWRSVKGLKSFQFNTKQQSHFITKFYQLAGKRNQSPPRNVEIYIRCLQDQIEAIKHKELGISFMDRQRQKVHFYSA